ncbi:HlyD family secretion protein [Altibacter sp. HG106]|uniref:HlyD family secretion protein n=1 Tax=Altibacter sp. HG106 TaxID=3023937 RepID=UPI002350516C|nr:HlyD family efflux transporter periplasmic adaptor subunit [Altibacter sp. HG106]MDC7994280.1 HlyD family efflux transporter periplasmic adaptor subunit [Altibacter sp. HG106]
MPQQQNIRSEAVQDILTKVPHWMIIWGNALIIACIVLFFAFSWFIKYPDVIASEAIVTSNQPPQKQYAPTAAKITSILVQDKEVVSEGTLLAVMENTANLTDVLQLKHILDTITLQQERFVFPLERLPLLSLGDIAPDYAVFEKDYIDYSLNQSLNPYANQAQGYYLSEKEIQLRIASLENQKVIDQQKFALSKKEFARNEQLYNKGVISLNEYEIKQLQFLEKEKNLNNLDISLSQLKQSLHETYQNSKDSKINHKMEETRLFKNLIQSFTNLKDAIRTWELNYAVTADVSGRVSFMDNWTEGQFVPQGTLLFTVIPDRDQHYFATIKAPIQNSGKIKTGQKVHIKLLNFPETEYGMLTASVASMSAIPNEEGYYLVKAQLDSELITSYQIEIPFRNEMNGTAEIITEDLRLLERFFYQLRGIFDS